MSNETGSQSKRTGGAKFYIATFRVTATNKTEEVFFSAESYVAAQDHAAHIACRELNDRGGQQRVALHVRPVAVSR